MSGLEGWAVVELMGHQVIAGRISEVQLVGATMLRVDVPGSDNGPAYTKFFGASAVYAITPTEAFGGEAARLLPISPTATVVPETVVCTGLAAGWCPIHGDCTCKDTEGEWIDGDSGYLRDCPLHGDASKHADR